MTDTVTIPLDLAERMVSYLGGGRLRDELATLLPRPDRAREVWDAAFAGYNAPRNTSVEVIRAALDAPRPMTPEVAAALRVIYDHATINGPVERAHATLAAQFEVRHDR